MAEMLHASSSLAIQSGDELDIPSWAYKLVRLGSSVARLNRNNRTDLVILLVPTRSFAAVFLAAGMVLEDQLVRISSVEEHFDWLCSLPPGTRIENDKREGTIVGVDRSGVAERLVVDIGKRRDAATRSTFPCHPNMARWMPRNSLRPERGSLHEKLTRHLVAGSETWFISVDPGPTVVICGERKVLISEVTTSLSTAPDMEDKAQLDEILLVNEYRYQKSFRRTRIESRRGAAIDLGDPTQQLVIYDGGRAFINRASDFKGTNQILVLEYGDSQLENVVQQVDEIWLDRVEDDEQGVRFPAPPEGCEMAHFQVRL